MSTYSVCDVFGPGHQESERDYTKVAKSPLEQHPMFSPSFIYSLFTIPAIHHQCIGTEYKFHYRQEICDLCPEYGQAKFRRQSITLGNDPRDVTA